MKITKSQLKQIIKEEIEEMLLEDESGYLSNIYAWCPVGQSVLLRNKKQSGGREDEDY